MDDKEKIETDINLIGQYGGIDGGHHKQWVLDQVVRVLLGDEYNSWLAMMRGEWREENGVYEYEYDDWDEGIAP
jgi:hypothetical protein